MNKIGSGFKETDREKIKTLEDKTLWSKGRTF